MNLLALVILTAVDPFGTVTKVTYSETNKQGRSLDFNAHFGYIRAKHKLSNQQVIKSKSFHSSRYFAVFGWRGFGENEVE